MKLFNKNSDKPKILGNFQEVSAGLSRRAAVEEARRCPQCHDPLCRKGCALNIDIPAFIRCIREGDPSGALAKIKEQNDFPGVCGRICLAPCEKACILGQEGKPIAIRALERFAADAGQIRNSHHRSPRPSMKTAVVGSGPAGLTASAQLARMGYQVTLFEAFGSAGGILSYGIPRFRLPPQVLKAEIQNLLFSGVRFSNHQFLGAGIQLNDLLSQGFSSVLLAIGMGQPEILDLPGSNLAGVYYAMEFLLSANSRLHSKNEIGINLGKRIAVLGHNSAALDCAGICRRLGKEVTVIHGNTGGEMEVYPGELEQAVREGVRIEGMTKPLRIIPAPDGGVAGVECMHLDFADPDQTGQWRLVPVPETKAVIDANSVILVNGHNPNTAVLKSGLDFKIKDNGRIGVDQNMMTSLPGIFAAGECAEGPEAVVDALASGKKAAENMDRYLKER